MKNLTMNEMMDVNGGYHGYAERKGNQELSEGETKVVKYVVLGGLYSSPLAGPVAAIQGWASEQ